MDRAKNTVRNIIWGFANQAVLLLFPFAIRTILLRVLGTEYLGLNSLFTSILSVLNMAELGFSSAVVFSMYEPIANDNGELICALLAFYRKVYSIIGCVVLGMGLMIMPFLPWLINGTYPADVNLYILYLLYILDTVLSYFLFAYKGSLLNAHHRNDLCSKISIAVRVIRYSAQIALLLIFRNYYVYLIVMPVCTVLENLLNKRMSEKYYPQYVCRGKLPKEVTGVIKKQVNGLMVSKVCGTLRNSLDSIILSAFIGLTTVGMYGNYYYILSAVHGVLTIIGTSMKAGVGNSIVKESKEKNFMDFTKFSFLYAWISGWFTCCMFGLYQPFMVIWTGSNDMLFPFTIMVLFCIYFFVLCMSDIRNVYMDAIGLWWEARYRSILECVANLVLNVLLGYLWGVTGVIMATLVTYVTINLTYGTKILFDNYFVNMSLWKYLGSQLWYFAATSVAMLVVYFACMINVDCLLLNFAYRIIVCIIIPNVVLAVLFQKDASYIFAKQFAKLLWKRIRK